MWGSFTCRHVIDDANENCGRIITFIALRVGAVVLLETNNNDDNNNNSDDEGGVMMVEAAVIVVTAAAMLGTDNT